MNSQSTSEGAKRPISTSGSSREDTDRDSSEDQPKTVKEEIVKSVKGQDDPVGKKHPDVPFLVVALTYLIVLGVVFLITALIIFFW